MKREDVRKLRRLRDNLSSESTSRRCVQRLSPEVMNKLSRKLYWYKFRQLFLQTDAPTGAYSKGD